MTKYETLGADVFEELWLFCDIDDIVTEYETLAADDFKELWLFVTFGLDNMCKYEHLTHILFC